MILSTLFWRCNILLCFCWVFSFVLSYLCTFMFPRSLCNWPCVCYASTVITIINLISLLTMTDFTVCGTPAGRQHTWPHILSITQPGHRTLNKGSVFRCADGRPSRSMFVCLVHLTGPHGPLHFGGGWAGGAQVTQNTEQRSGDKISHFAAWRLEKQCCARYSRGQK